MPSFETPEPVAVTVELFLGDTRITASDRIDTSVEVHPSNPANAADIEAAQATMVDCRDGRLTIRTPKQWRRFTPFDNHGSVQVAIEVPTGSSIDAESSLGDIHGEGELGACRIKTSMGHIRLDHTGALQLKTSYGNIAIDDAVGDVDAHTGSGEIRIEEIHGCAVIKNSNGNTWIGEVSGDVRVKAANGEITIDRALQSVTAKSANGAIAVGEVTRGVTVMETSAGALRCGIAEGTAAWLDVRSQYGRVHSTLDVTSGPAASDETVEVRGRTSIGDIAIHRA